MLVMLKNYLKDLFSFLNTRRLERSLLLLFFKLLFPKHNRLKSLNLLLFLTNFA